MALKFFTYDKLLLAMRVKAYKTYKDETFLDKYLLDIAYIDSTTYTVIRNSLLVSARKTFLFGSYLLLHMVPLTGTKTPSILQLHWYPPKVFLQLISETKPRHKLIILIFMMNLYLDV